MVCPGSNKVSEDMGWRSEAQGGCGVVGSGLRASRAQGIKIALH